MDDQEQLQPDELETQDDTTENAEDVDAEDQISAEELAELRKAKAERDELAKKYEDVEKKNKQLYARAKKTDTKEQEPKQDELSYRDTLALAKSDVHDDDVDEVVRFARFSNVSIAEALHSPTLRAILDGREEERKTAQAAQTRSSARSQGSPKPDQLLKKAQSGQTIEGTEENYRALYEARRAEMRK